MSVLNEISMSATQGEKICDPCLKYLSGGDTSRALLHNDSNNEMLQDFEAELQGIWAIIEANTAHPSVFWICFSLLLILTLVLLASKVWLLFEIEGVFIYSSTLMYLLFLLTHDIIKDSNVIHYQTQSAIYKCASALLVLLSWINFTASLRFLLLGKHYCLGNYISMLTQVAKKVALFFLLYVPVLVGFTIAFYLTIPDDFDNPIRITKTLAMMIGELDFGDTFGDKDFFRNMLFFAFALAVTVVISNLLIGLTVSDVAELLEKAKMEGMEFKLKQITQMDTSWTMTILSCMLGCCTNSSHMISGQDQLDMEVVLLPNRAKPGFIQPGSIVQVFEMKRNKDNQRVIGEPWSFLRINTFVYGLTVDKAIEAAQRLENKAKKGSSSSVSTGLSK